MSEEKTSNILTTIQGRRTIRKYKKDEIDKNKLKQLLESVQYSQSWNNSQCWEIVLVKELEIKKSIQKLVPNQNPAFKSVVDSPLLLVLCAKLGVSGQLNGTDISSPGDWFMFDSGIATQNLCNCAHDLGLGTVVVGWFNHDGVKNVIALPDNYKVIALIPVGYPDHKGSSPARKKLHEFVHKDQFGNLFDKASLLSGIADTLL